MWSCGANNLGQLCHGDKEDRSMFQKTSFSNISKASAGYRHSLFENNKGEIFACGDNQWGQCGLGHLNSPQITPSLIPNVPSNIVQFVCGEYETLFLDWEGNVFSVGDIVMLCSVGILNKIPNIPPIKIISFASSSCYLIDWEGNLWTFGDNGYGQLGHGDYTDIYTPKIINTLKDIQQISYGSCGTHFFAKSSLNLLFAIGDNAHGQLGTGDKKTALIPKEINSQYFNIWGAEHHSRAKSARK